jgi:trehalose 6-phosphate synthase
VEHDPVSRLVVISNRVAMPGARGAAGAQGGLAGALLAALRRANGLWIGWSGRETPNPAAEPELQTHDGVTIATIDLDPQDVEEYYNGYANSTLWPLFHYRIDLAQYDRETGKGYERVNELFARAAAPLIGPDDTVWVHDYHFMPLGDLLRRQGARNRIGFFLHIPWPPRRLLTVLPYHERLVRTLFAYDVIGFQSREWLDSFLDYCRDELGARVDAEAGTVDFEGRTICARRYPIGIDCEHFMAAGDTGESRQTQQRMLASTRHRTAMVGVDRLDYSKGLPERLDGVARFFENNPHRVRDLVFIQIAPPSREDIGSYQKIRADLEQKTGRINGMYSRIDLVPVRYVNQGHSAAELFGIYRTSKIGLVTPLRDGMNLVAKEYVAAQDPDDPGVLILSRFTGAAEQLTGALLVNPHSADDIAHAIATALDMPLEKRKARWEQMIAVVRDEDVTVWSDNFLRDLRGDRAEDASA